MKIQMTLILYLVVWLLNLSLIFMHRLDVLKKDGIYSIDLSKFEANNVKEVKFKYKDQNYILHLSLTKDVEHGIEVVVFKEKILLSTFNYFSDVKLINNSVSFTVICKSNCSEFFDNKYFVNLNLKCSKTNSELIFEDVDVSKFTLKFKWFTPLVCQIIEKSYVSCAYEINNHLFDLSPLKEPINYKIKSGALNFQFNFCMSFNKKNSVAPNILSGFGKENKFFWYFNQNNLQSINYYAEKLKLIFTFLAQRSDNETKKIFVHLVCQPDLIKSKPQISVSRRKINIYLNTYLACIPDDRCEFYDKNLRYSLPQVTHAELPDKLGTFLLSPCANLGKKLTGLEEESYAVLINGSVNDNRSIKINLGATRLFHFNFTSKIIQLYLTNGSFCPGTKVRAITEIKFKCSKSINGPSFISKSDNCKFLFNWDSPSLCPIPAAFSADCLLRDPIYGYIFDMRNRNSKNVFEIQNNEGIFKINLCGKVDEPCGTGTDAAICFLGNKNITIGKRAHQQFVSYKGKLLFKLKGEECSPGVFYKVFVNVVCDYGASNDSAPVFMEISPNCVFRFMWKSKRSCPNELSVPCTTKNETGIIDLTPLRRLSSNYVITNKNNNATFLLNICGSLWFGENQTCPIGSGVCEVYNENFRSLGKIHEGPVIDKNGLIIFYQSLYLCPNKITDIYMGTIIIFLCDSVNQELEYVGFYNCNYTFTMKTVYACPKMYKIKNNFRKDLVSSENATDLSRSILNTTSTIVYRMVTTMKFTTSKPMNSTFKKLIKSNVSCFLSNSEKSTNLTPQNVTNNENNTSQFEMCPFLNSFIGDCYLVLACLMYNMNTTSNLGSHEFASSFEKNSSIVLKYQNGTSCEEDKRFNYSTTLIFSCNRKKGFGVPKLQTPLIPCAFSFLWENRITCPDDKLKLKRKTCDLLNEVKKNHISLKSILNFKKFTEKNNFHYSINLCPSTVIEGSCHGDFCIKNEETWISMGHFKNAVFSNIFNRTEIFFNKGDSCGLGRFYSSKIYLKCSSKLLNDLEFQSRILWEDDCNILLEIKTPFACYFNSYSSSFPSTILIVTLLLSFAVVIIVMILYYSKIFFFFKNKIRRKTPYVKIQMSHLD